MRFSQNKSTRNDLNEQIVEQFVRVVIELQHFSARFYRQRGRLPVTNARVDLAKVVIIIFNNKNVANNSFIFPPRNIVFFLKLFKLVSK